MKISQREARILRKRVTQLENEKRDQRSRYSSEWVPGWVNICTLNLTDADFAKIHTARLLNHALIVVPEQRGTDVLIYAEPLR